MTTQEKKTRWYSNYVWLIVAGPALVVVASFITLYLAIRSPDPVVDNDYYQKGVEINKTLNAKRDALAPAVQARNHAATGIKPTSP